jgi:hypothetical protein
MLWAIFSQTHPVALVVCSDEWRTFFEGWVFNWLIVLSPFVPNLYCLIGAYIHGFLRYIKKLRNRKATLTSLYLLLIKKDTIIIAFYSPAHVVDGTQCDQIRLVFTISEFLFMQPNNELEYGQSIYKGFSNCTYLY